MADGAAQGVDRIGDRLMRWFWRKPPANIAERTRRRVTVHLVPYLFFLYILAYLDRVNVSVAQLGMGLPPSEQGVGFTKAEIGFGAGLFFFGYWILEIPSTISVVRWGARWVFVRILISWGLFATLVGFIGLPVATKAFGLLPTLPENFLGMPAVANYVNQLPTNPAYQFYFFRFMLGFFEGGFFPSVIMYLSLWFRPQDRAKAIALFMAAIPLSSALGLPVSGLLLGVNWLGLTGWRWIFILEGILPIIAGVLTLFMLPDGPTKAKWLAPDERDWLVGELEAEHRLKQTQGHWEWVHHLGMVLLLTLVYFGQNVMNYGLNIFMPAIIKSQSGTSNQVASFLATIPFALAFAGMLINGWHSDKTRERIWHVAVPLLVTSAALYVAAALDNIPLAAVLVTMFLVGTFMYAHLPAFWPIPTMFLGATTAASAIGFINMIGNLGGFYGPYLVGASADEDIQWVARLEEHPGNTVSGDDAVRLKTIESSISDSGKLSAEENNQLRALFGQIRVGRSLDDTQREELRRLMSKGSSFASGLRRIAPWSILAGVIILVVGLARRGRGAALK